MNRTEFREWDYGSSTLLIDSCSFDNNTAGNGTTGAFASSSSSSKSTKDNLGFGGALHVLQMRTTIRSSVFTRNAAAASGGAIHLGPGSASLLVEGSSRMLDNQANSSGTSIYRYVRLHTAHTYRTYCLVLLAHIVCSDHHLFGFCSFCQPPAAPVEALSTSLMIPSSTLPAHQPLVSRY
jgi:hypothetical protein